MDRYLAGEHIDLETLIDDLEKAVARGSFYPVTAVVLGGLGATSCSRSCAAASRPRWSTRCPR
jgi:hypothetical protein